MNPLEITAQEAHALLEAGTPLKMVDVREQNEFDSCRIEGALLLPLSSFVENFERQLPNKNEKILLFCHHGMRSLRAAEYLSSRGYADVKSIIGGIDLWSEQIDPEIPRY